MTNLRPDNSGDWDNLGPNASKMQVGNVTDDMGFDVSTRSYVIYIVDTKLEGILVETLELEGVVQDTLELEGIAQETLELEGKVGEVV